MKPELTWEPLQEADLADVDRIARAIHPSLFERLEVFAEKRRLFPHGCRKLVKDGQCVGYGIAHPWRLATLPPLDSFVGRLPPEPSCLHLHDMAVLRGARKAGAPAAFIEYARSCARRVGLPALAMVSVYGTDVLWSRFGFRPHTSPQLTAELSCYGPTAKYLICDLA